MSTETVREFEPPGRFHVDGNSTPFYLVDISAYSGNSWCGCPDFEMRRMPELKDGKRAAMEKHHLTEWPHPTMFRCRHIQAVIRFIDRRDGPGAGDKLAVELSKLPKSPGEQ